MGFIGNYEGSSGRLASQLGEAIGGGLGELTGSYFANNALNSVLKDPSLKDADPEERLSALQQKLAPYGQRGEKMFTTALKIEDKREKKQQQNLLAKGLKSELTPQEESRMTEENQFKLFERKRAKQLGARVRQTLLDRNVPEEMADYYGELISSTEKGTGQSAVINDALNAANRYGSQPESGAFIENKGSGKFSKNNPDFEFPEPQPIQYKTAKEKSDIEEKNVSENLKLFTEEHARKRDYQELASDFNKLENLNPYISKGWSKWNINQTDGKILLPAQAKPEERQFVKIINRQLDKAQGTYGGKVSNFEAGQFLQRYPDLADNYESRKALIKDLKDINDINLEYANAMDEVERTYNPRVISPDQLQRIAGDMIEDKVSGMRSQYEQVGQNKNGLRPGEVEVTWEGKRYAVPKEEAHLWKKPGATQ